MNRLKTPLISAIAAMSQNRVIGDCNQLPWHMPADLKHFKEITNGRPIIMGRKTYDSIGRPLPNRLNIVMSKHPSWQAPNCLTVSSLSEALAQETVANHEEIFIIGGASIYEQLLPQIKRIYLTIIHQEFAGDRFFPVLREDEWQEISRQKCQADAANPYDYDFVVFSRQET